MNNRLADLEDAFPRRTRPLLMAALVAGDPFVEATLDYMHAVVAGGADLVELIVPFSDPVYHGPVLRRASRRAMNENVRWEDVCRLISEFRDDDDDTPLLVSSYFNRIVARGPRLCARQLGEAGADAVMVEDLPAEEASEFREHLHNQQMALIQSIAVTTAKHRFRRLASRARGFLVWTGHSGAQPTVDPDEVQRRIRQFRPHTSLPIVVSMNIESGEEAARVADAAHGVVVGSALAWLVEGKGPQVDQRLEAFVADVRLHLDGIEQ